MSEQIRANITRTGVASPIASNIVCQLDELSALEAATYQGADPHFTYKAFTTMLPIGDPQLVRYLDYVIDQAITDVLTGNPRKYLIVGEPKMHRLNGHWRFICTRLVGT